jgi:hypothetical protein
VTYVPNSTFQQLGSGALTLIPDNATGTPFPLDEGGLTNQVAPAHEITNYHFRVTIDETAPCTQALINTAGLSGGSTQTSVSEVTVLACTPAIAVTKAVNPTEIEGTGGVASFSVEVVNTGPVPITLNTLNDNVFGDITTTDNISSTTCALPQELDPTEVYSCSFQAFVEGDEATPHVNTVTGTGVDSGGIEVEDDDDATVTFDLRPAIETTKTPDPSQINGTGGVVTFTVTVVNAGPVSVTVPILWDNRFGNIATTNHISSTTCIVPQHLDPAQSYTCSFQAFVEGDEATPHTNTVRALAIDRDRNIDIDPGDATVTFRLPPAINVVKIATPPFLSTSGVVTFHVGVQNTGPVPLTLTSLNDDVFGDITSTTNISSTTCVLPQQLALRAVYTCSFQAFVDQLPHINTVTGTGVDGGGEEVDDADPARVIISTDPIQVPVPEIEVTKDADPTVIIGSGGVVTFTVQVQNTGPISVTLTSLNDDVFGDITTTTNISSTTCVLPQELNLLEVYSCTFQAFVEGDEATSHVNTVTGNAIDINLNPATDDDDATVTFDLLPAIAVTKTVAPAELEVFGAVVTYTVVVQNTGPVSVTLSANIDDRFGNLTTTEAISSTTCTGPQDLDPAESYTCSFQAFVEGTSATPHTNTVVVYALDDDGNETSDPGDATVIFPPPTGLGESEQPGPRRSLFVPWAAEPQSQ